MRRLFEHELAFEGMSVGAFGGISRSIEGTKIAFDSPDILANAAAVTTRWAVQEFSHYYQNFVLPPFVLDCIHGRI